MDLSLTYRRLVQVPEERLVIVPLGTSIAATELKVAIVFVLANWSGASQVAFRALNNALSRHSDLQDLKLYVADTDDERTEEFIIRNGDIPSGNGETYWIKGGAVIAKMVKYDESQQPTLHEYTERVLL